MTVSVAVPGWKPQKQEKPKKDALDMIAQGLQIAQAAYGIYADSEKLDIARKGQAVAKEKEALDKKVAEAAIKKSEADTAYTNQKALSEAFPGQKPANLITVQGAKDVYAFNPNTGTHTPLGIGVKGAEPKEGAGKYTANDGKFWDSTISEFRSNKRVLKAEESGNAATLVEGYLKQRTPQADGQVMSLMNKLAQDPSAPSESQLKTAGASQDLLNRYKSWKQKLIEGGATLTDQDRANIAEIARLNKKIASEQIEKFANQIAKDKAAVSDLTDEEIKARFLRPQEIVAEWQENAEERFAATTPPATAPWPSLPGGKGITPQGIQQQRLQQQQVPVTWGQRIGVEAGADPQVGYDPDAFIQKNKGRR